MSQAFLKLWLALKEISFFFPPWGLINCSVSDSDVFEAKDHKTTCSARGRSKQQDERQAEGT